jgi:hypothetical protein
MPNQINADQLDLVASELEAAGTATRQLSIKAAGVTEAKLGFSWEFVEILASAFSFSATRSTFTLTNAASANANVTDFATLLKNGIDSQTLVTTTAAADEFSLSGLTLSVHGDIRANGATYRLRYIVGTASGAASASGNQIWLATVPQQPLQPESDYFQSNAIDPKWEEWDVDGNLTVSVDGQGLLLTEVTAAGQQFAGIIQDAPADNEFAVTAKLRLSGSLVSFQDIALIIGEDLSAGTGAPSTASFFGAVLVASATKIQFENGFWTDYNTFGASTTGEEFTTNVAYARIYIDRGAETATFLFSVNGRDWVIVGPIRSWAAGTVTSISSIGIGVNNVNSGFDVKGRADMFRVDITTDPFLPVGGFVGTSVPSTFFDRQDVTVVANGTVNIYGWNDRKAKLIKVEAFSVTTASVGAYTMALTKDPGGSADNMFAFATFDMTSLTNGVPGDVTLTGTADDLILDASVVWQATFTSDNAGLDAAGVYFQLTWLVL